METSKTTSDRSDIALGFVCSLLVNMLWLVLQHHDQRMILVAVISVVAGLIMLARDSTGAYGMGIILGAMAAGMIGLALVGAGVHVIGS